MNEKTLKLLEFDTIRRAVADRALSDEAAELILSDLPLRDEEAVRDLRDITAALCERIASGDEEPRLGIPAVAFLFPKLEVEGSCLEIDEAYALGLFAERTAALKRWIAAGERNSPADEESGGSRGRELLQGFAAEIPDPGAVSKEVFSILEKDGSLRDLPEFREIKRRILKLQGELEAVSSRYTSSEETRRMLQSALPSQRDGRMVLAVKANFRGRIKGIVHEVSSTGQTVFVEPEDVVEKNNDILIEKRRLDAEILRVLRELTRRIAPLGGMLEDVHGKIIYLECIRARARYSYESRGVFAAWGNPMSLVLNQARHPLLRNTAVPIDFAMSGNTRTVIITGPNTGGKTVTLKTVGLFALMNQFGLALPAEEGTALPVFDGVFADIGDEQSISQSLSTFSAHMTNIASITADVTEHSLVLLDELGSGTDPEEGSAIAMAILDFLIEKKAAILATTHHGILKNYGYTREGVENASVEFDGRTLSPTYRILMGIPGESRAVDIASRNGLSPEIISQARSYLDEERSDVSALITGLKQKHRDLDSAAEERKAEDQRLRELRRAADLKELRLRQKEFDLKKQSAGTLGQLLTESRKTLENLVREVREGELTREKTLKVKDFLSGLEKSVAEHNASLEEEGRELAEERHRFDTEEKGRAGEAGSALPEIGPGVAVLAGQYKRKGTVVRAGKKGTWIVEIGSLKMSFPGDELIPLAPDGQEKKAAVSTELASSPQPQFELSLRGMRLDEALGLLQRQIDAAALSGLYEFSVIHGKGEGILQKGVHDFLKRQPMVADYYFSRPELGGFGRTEVVLKRS